MPLSHLYKLCSFRVGCGEPLLAGSSGIRNAFAVVQLPGYTAHSFRKTLVQEMSDRQLPLDAQKAWSQNLGHENIATTFSAYLPVSTQRQGELIKRMK